MNTQGNFEIRNLWFLSEYKYNYFQFKAFVIHNDKESIHSVCLFAIHSVLHTTLWTKRRPSNAVFMTSHWNDIILVCNLIWRALFVHSVKYVLQNNGNSNMTMRNLWIPFPPFLFQRQWSINGGKCGVCGDPWNGPREHEAGGKYATGLITKSYTEGATINVELQITASHLGFFEFRLCPNNNPKKAVTQDCLDQHLLHQPDGQTRVTEVGRAKTYQIQLVLPAEVTCSQCLLQWKWNTGMLLWSSLSLH